MGGDRCRGFLFARGSKGQLRGVSEKFFFQKQRTIFDIIDDDMSKIVKIDIVGLKIDKKR
jgi:hypothetical protein